MHPAVLTTQDHPAPLQDQPATLESCPPELLLLVVDHILLDPRLSPQVHLAWLSRVSRTFRALAQPLLYHAPCVTSLGQFDLLLSTLEKRGADGGWGHLVRRFRVQGSVFAKGYGVRVQKLLRAAPHLEEVELVGLDDLRAKHLVGTGTVTQLTLLNSSFRPNSHTCPPTLPTFLSGLTSLTLANLGLPPPSTHLTDLLTHCAPTLEHLALSSLRDVDLLEFRRACGVLARKCGKLSSLMLGFLTDEQVHAFCLPLLAAEEAGGKGKQAVTVAHGLPTPPASPIAGSLSSLAPAIAHLPLTHLTFTLPLPSLPLILALPPTLRVLTIRPPYARPTTSFVSSGGSTTIWGTSKPSLLTILDRSRVHAETTPAPSGSATPLRGRRPSVTLEQLEEEESVLLALEEALAVPTLPAKRGAEVPLLSPGEVVAPRLEKIRWECRAMRCGKERVRALVEKRREWRGRVYGHEA